MEFDSSGDGDDGGFAGSAGAEVAGFFGGAGAGPVGSIADVEGWGEDLQQKRCQGQVKLVRGEIPL